MIFVVKLCLLMVVLVVGAEEKYTTKFDNIDYDEILKSDRLLKNYVNCLMDRGSCTPDGSELKKNLADALQTDCTKCSDAQKAGAKKIIRFLIENKHDWFNELQDKYDPAGIYKKKYDAELKKEGLSLN